MKSSLRMLVAAVALPLWSCASPSNEGASTPQPDEFAAAKRWIAELGLGEQFRDFQIQETDSAYAKRFRALSQEKRELREFTFRGVARPGHPAAAGAMQIDRVFLAAAGDAVPADEWDFDAMVALAARQRLRLASLEDARWFLRADGGLPPMDVMPTHEEHRIAFRIGFSGVPEVGAWNELVLDASGVPQRIEWSRADASARQP